MEIPGSLFGNTLSGRSFGDFMLTERSYPAGYTTPIHAHAQPLFCVVLAGGYEEHHRGVSRRCSPGAILFHAAGEEHRERFDAAGGRSLIVQTAPAWLDRLSEIHPVCRRTLAMDGGPAHSIGRRLYEEFRGSDSASPLVIEGLLLQLAGEFARSTNRSDWSPPWLGSVTDLLNSSYRANLSLATIGRTVGAHPVHVAQVFRRFHGCTIGEYVRKLRIDSACHALVRTDAPLARIAADNGFADQSHFGRSFKAITGMSPLRYRLAKSADSYHVHPPAPLLPS